MEIFLDTANVEKLQKYIVEYDLSGFACNPTLVSREKIEIEELAKIVPDKIMFGQVIGKDLAQMLIDAEKLRTFRKDIIIKVPCTAEGYKAMVELRKRNYRVLATAIYTLDQAMLAASCGVEYVAPYVNRIFEDGRDGCAVVGDMVRAFEVNHYKTKVLGASFKNMNQLNQLMAAGIHAVAVSTDIFEKWINNSLTNIAVENFTKDWVSVFDRDTL